MNEQDGDTVVISPGHELEPGSIPIRAVEVVIYLNENGDEAVAIRYQGVPNIVAELGMLEYAKGVLIAGHNGRHQHD